MTPRFRREKDDPEAPDEEADRLSDEELMLQHAQALPDRAALSTLDADIAIPLNPAVAADVLAGETEVEGDEPDASGHDWDADE